ncbi:MAG: glycogen debranching enzyme N-terminal domain-containing protein, partial [Anaerolineae bacterium]
GDSRSLSFRLKGYANHRHHHGRTRAAERPVRVEQMPHGLQITANGAAPFYVLSDGAKATPQHEWYTGYYLSVEDYRGLEAEDDHLYAGLFETKLQPGDSVTLVASTKANARLDGGWAYAER